MVLMATTMDGYIDLSLEELTALGFFAGAELPGFLLQSAIELTEGQLRAAAASGERALRARGLLRGVGEDVEVDAAVLEAVRVASQPAMVLLALHCGEKVELSWLLCGGEQVTVITRLPGGVLRVRLLPLSETAGAVQRLLPTPDAAEPSPDRAVIDITEIRDLLRGSAAGVDSGNGKGAVELSVEAHEALRRSFGAGARMNGLFAMGPAEDGHTEGRSLWWSIDPSGALFLVDSCEDRMQMVPASSVEVWTTCRDLIAGLR